MPDLRYKRLAYIALQVRDSGRSAAFLKNIVGLDDGAPAAGGRRFLRCSNDHHNVVLTEGAEPKLERLGFEMESERELDAAEAHLRSLGLSPVQVDGAECRALGQGRSIRFVEPGSGLTLELLASMEPSGTPYRHTITKIARLGHVVLGAARPQQTADFFVKQLNFKVSDVIDGMVTFMRCFPNPFHHSLAIVQAPENRLHHVNFMVTDLDDIGRALNRLKQNDVPIVFGPGRHPPSESVFLYFLDPDGITFELSYEMEEFPENGARAPRVLPPARESFDYWQGSPPDPRMGTVGRFVPGVAREAPPASPSAARPAHS
jgi:2,3-dihydroxy-p-cumate/2,3-dihydroxybenzoate 3,4-dioxygenase